jgi:hypothetical protein
MAGMTFSEVFANYYTRYRGDSDIPTVTDPEWAIAVQLYNTAVRRWEHIDGVLWNELFSDTAHTGTGATLIFSGGLYPSTGYACPTAMASPGGTVSLRGTGNASFDVPVVSPEDVQVMNLQGPYAYFVGNRHSGFTLYINVGGADSAYNGYTIFYPFYLKAGLISTTADPTTVQASTVVQCSDPEFIIDTMVAERFLESRNFPAYQIFNQQATQALANLEVRNSMGMPHNAWKVNDYGAGWGNQNGTGSFFS